MNRPRGLCWTCYYRPGLRQRYPSTSKFARRGSGPGNCRTRPPAEPTPALPGTEAKVAALEARAANCEDLWHPGDATR